VVVEEEGRQRKEGVERGMVVVVVVVVVVAYHSGEDYYYHPRLVVVVVGEGRKGEEGEGASCHRKEVNKKGKEAVEEECRHADQENGHGRTRDWGHHHPHPIEEINDEEEIVPGEGHQPATTIL